jgi:glycosyltransferase involved in cell wall biosynthesis
MSEPTFDVVIPLYNGAETIVETLESVLAQTRLPDRIFVVNDGSTDDGPERVRSLGNPLVSVIDAPQRGVGAARNLGIKTSTATYVAFLDADDLWLPKKLARQLELFRRNPQTKVVYCASELVSMHNHQRVLDIYKPRLKGHVFREVACKGVRVAGSASSIAVAREVFETAGLFDESMDYAEDDEMWARLAEHFAFDCVADRLVKLVKNPHSRSRATSYEAELAMLMSYLTFKEKIAARLRDRDNVSCALRHIGVFAVSRRLQPKALRILLGDIGRRFPTLTAQAGLRLGVPGIYMAYLRHLSLTVRLRPRERLRRLFLDGAIVLSNRT